MKYGKVHITKSEEKLLRVTNMLFSIHHKLLDI